MQKPLKTNLKSSKNLKSNIGWLLFFLMVACSSFPKRDFETELYLIDWETHCFLREDDNGDITELCQGHPDYTSIIGISVDDYTLERNYQDTLIQQCRRWRSE